MKLLTATALAAAILAGPAIAADHQVSIRGMAFQPATLEVAAGDTVTFTNTGSAPHTATARNGAFDTGRLGTGQSATIRIGSAGTLDYFCTIHPRMTGQITAR